MITAIAAILMFCILIFIHEFGHFAAAKACGVRVNKFALGMGPAFLKKQKGETEYSLRVFPIGGFCEMEGEDEESEDPRAFSNKKSWQKAVILVAGPAMNFLLALLLMIFLTYQMGTATTTLDVIIDGSPAQEAGLLTGDELVSVNGHPVEEWTDLTAYINSSETEEQTIVVRRDGEEITIVSGTYEEGGRRMIGVQPAFEKDLAGAFVQGPRATWNLTRDMYGVLKQLFTGGVSAKELSGPVGIVYIVNQTVKTGLLNMIYLMALISLNLGIMNLLPFPALDGGRLVFVVIRKLTGKRVTDEMEAKVNIAGFLVLIALMLYVTWNDIVRFIAPLFGG
ncbi:MAG: RIP metalloprotease RseP [Clostridiales bacterium]|nr:RIP metalloprotease RseP [Clostridiales bacterium]